MVSYTKKASRGEVAASRPAGGAGTDTLTLVENLTGSLHNDTLTGNGGANRLEGLGGVDTLDGGAGDDAMFGGIGNDGMRGSVGFDHYDGGSDADTVNFALASGVNVFLDGSGTNGKAALGDTFANVENILGGIGADFLVGDGGTSVLRVDAEGGCRAAGPCWNPRTDCLSMCEPISAI